MGIRKFYQKIAAPAIKRHSRWSGITNILSGQTVITVSAAQVKSGSPPLLSLGLTTVTSHRAIILSCNSIVDNTSFAIVADKATTGGPQQVVYTVLEG